MSRIQLENGYYSGDTSSGHLDGKGTFYFEDGTRCTGTWSRDSNEGWGYFIDKNNVKYLAEWCNKCGTVLMISSLPIEYIKHCQRGTNNISNKHNRLELFSQDELYNADCGCLYRASMLGLLRAEDTLIKKSKYGIGLATCYLAQLEPIHNKSRIQELFCTAIKQGSSEAREPYIKFLLKLDFNKAMDILDGIIIKKPKLCKNIMNYVISKYHDDFEKWFEVETNEAIEEYYLVCLKNRRESDIIKDIGLEYLNRKKPEKALTWLYESAMLENDQAYTLIRSHSDLKHPEYLFKLAALEELKGHYQEMADACYKLYKTGDKRGFGILNKHSHNPETAYVIGLIKFENDPTDYEYIFQSASKKYQPAIDFLENNFNFDDSKQVLRYANLLFIEDDIEQAIRLYNFVKIFDPKEVRRSAEELLNNQQIKDRLPNKIIDFNLGELFRQVGILNLAKTYYKNAMKNGFISFTKESLTIFNDPQSIDELILSIPDSHHLDEEYIRIIEKLPQSKNSHKILGDLQRSRNHLVNAMQLYDVPELKDDTKVLYLLGNYFIKKGLKYQAKEMLERGSRLGDDDCKKLLKELNDYTEKIELKSKVNGQAIVSSKLLHAEDERKRKKGIH